MISSIPSDTFSDIYDVWQPEWWQKPSFWGILIIFCLFVIIGFGIVRWRKKIKNKKTPKQLLLDTLHSIVESTHKDIENQSHLYTAMIDLLKSSFTYRYAVKVSGLTEYELYSFLQDDKYDAEIKNLLKVLIENAYYIKYSQKKIVREQIQEDVEKISLIIKKLLVQKTHS